MKKKPEQPKTVVTPPARTHVAPSSKPSATIPTDPSKSDNGFFERLGKKAPLLVTGIIFLICVVVFFDYLTFEKTYVFKDIGSDTANIGYPYLTYIGEYILHFGVPKWSFNMGMGQSIFPFFLRDPFDIFLYLAGKDHVYFGIVFKEVAKIILSGVTFFYYLRMLRLSDFTAICGSILFSFCGFVIIGGQWNIFSFEAFNMALLLLAFEKLFTENKWVLFPVPIFLISMSQPFNLYVYGLFLAAYAVLRLFQTDAFTWKNAGKLFGQMIGLGVIGMLLSAPFMIEDIVQILESPRGSGTNSYAHVLSSQPMFAISDNVQLGTSILRFFSSDILGSGNEFTGWQNTLEAPLFYIGLPCLLLMPQVFPTLKKKAKISFIVFISLWFMPIIFPWFRYAFWLFSGDYFRGYSVIVSFALLYYALFALDYIVKNRKINVVVLGVTLVILLIMLYYPYSPGTDALRNNAVTPTLNSPVSVFVCCMLLAYGVILFLIGKQNSPDYLKYVFFGCLVVEVLFLSRISVNDRDTITAADLTQKVGYNDYSVEAIKYIKDHDKSFYRIDKTYASSPAMHYSLNDGMAQDYYGTSAYNPFNQEYYIRYLQLMGISNKANELESRWANGLAYRPILESGNSVKYILAKNKINPIWRITCDSLATFGDVKVFRNKFVMPFGYTYSYYVKESDFGKISAVQKDFLSLKLCVVGDADINKVAGLKEFPLKDTMPESSFSADFYRQEVNDLSRDTMVVSKFENNFISGTINSSDDKMMYLSVPIDAGWKLKVDGQPREKIILDGGMTGVMLKKGQHTIEMSFDLRYFMKGVYLCLLGLLIYVALFFYKRKTA